MSLEEIRQTERYKKLAADRQSLTDLGHEIVELAGHLNAAHYRFLMLIAEWDTRKGWADGASQSCAHWLNWKCGIDMGAAREKVRTAHALCPSLSAETARRLACDCNVVPILESEEGEPLNVGRKTRSIPPAIQRALNARDRGCCRFPGCPNTRYLDGHHIHHWAHGGETKLSNLVSVCRFHHRQVHEGNVAVRVLDDGAIRFVTPDGRSFDSTLCNHTQPMGDWHRLAAAHEQQHLLIDGHTASTRWDGEPYDHAFAIEALLYRWRNGSQDSRTAPHRSAAGCD